MAGGVIRPLKSGGCSECKASDQNIGKHRCNHILDNAKMVVIQREKGVKFVDISGQVDGKDSSFSIKAADEDIRKYITNLSSGLSKKERENILTALRNE